MLSSDWVKTARYWGCQGWEPAKTSHIYSKVAMQKKQEWVPGVQLCWTATVGKGPWQTNPIIPVKIQYQEITMDSTCPSENPFLVHWDEALWKFQMWPRFHFPRRSRATDGNRVHLRIYPLENHLSPACKLSNRMLLYSRSRHKEVEQPCMQRRRKGSSERKDLWV